MKQTINNPNLKNTDDSMEETIKFCRECEKKINDYRDKIDNDRKMVFEYWDSNIED